jgi:hypothetical protein
MIFLWRYSSMALAAADSWVGRVKVYKFNDTPAKTVFIQNTGKGAPKGRP